MCDCYDYVFKCIEEKYDREWCKHILRVWAEVQIHELPPLGVSPTEWLTAKLTAEYDRRSDRPESTMRLAIGRMLTRLTEDSSPTTCRKATALYRRVNGFGVAADI